MEITRGKIQKAKKVVIYGPEGIGKSTFAAKFPGAVFVDTEGSTNDMDVARLPRPTSWNMLFDEIEYIKTHTDECRTLVIDTVDWAELLCVEHICAVHNKKGIEDFGYGNGYVYTKEEFGRFLNKLSDLIEVGINVVLIAHAQLRKFEQPDELGAYDRWELKLGKKTQSQTSPLVKEWADMLLFANYKTFSVAVTAVLDGPNDLAQEGANANEILIPKMSMSGLADYDKQTGYALGDVTLDYETKKCDYDRGRMFTVDAMDNIESAGIAFGRLSGEFLRTQVVPELDTWRLAKYAGYASGNNVATGAIADGKAGIAAIRAGKTAIKNAEAKTETCYLFISTTLKGMIDDLDTTASKKAMEDWAGVIEVPASRFFDKVTLTKTGAGGFATTGGKAIDFLIVDKNAAIQYQKHTVSKIITPEQNQTADAWKFGYRTVGIAEAQDNKKVAIYVHKAGE